MSDIRHVVLIHGAWARGDSWGPARTAFEERGYIVHTPTPTVDFAAVTTPVLVIRGECDRVVPPQIAPKTAARYRRGTYVQVPRADHLPFSGRRYPSPWATSTTGLPRIACSVCPTPETETAPGCQSRGQPDELGSV